MSRTITIDPVTRIEGHSKITIQLDEQGEVTDAHFHVTQFRGFERIVQGRAIRRFGALDDGDARIRDNDRGAAASPVADARCRRHLPDQVLGCPAGSLFHDPVLHYGTQVAPPTMESGR